MRAYGNDQTVQGTGVMGGKDHATEPSGLVVSMLASGTRVRGFKPGRSRWIFRASENPPHAFLRRGSERICPMSQLCGM